MVFTVGKFLTAELFAINKDDKPFKCTGALHTYFNVGDISKVILHGLENTKFDEVHCNTLNASHDKPI